MRTNTSVLKDLAEKCIFSPLRQINAMSDKKTPINQKCVETFFNLFNNLYAVD